MRHKLAQNTNRTHLLCKVGQEPDFLLGRRQWCAWDISTLKGNGCYTMIQFFRPDVFQISQPCTLCTLLIDEAYLLSGCQVANGELTGAIDPKGFECGSKASGGKKKATGGKNAVGGPINALVMAV